MNRRPTLRCGACGYSWQTRGKDYALACPNCRTRLATATSSARGGCGCLSVIAVGVVLFLLFSHSDPKNDATKQRGISTTDWKDVRRQYVENATAAKARFHGQRAEWSATVHSTGQSPDKREGKFAVLDPDLGSNGTVFAAWFVGGHEKEVASLKPGEIVSVSCSIGDVVVVPSKEVIFTLDDCSVRATTPSASASVGVAPKQTASSKVVPKGPLPTPSQKQ